MTVTDGLAAVLFDMDGLLVDTEPLWFETESEVMARLGAPWTHEDQAALLGGSMERSIAYLLAKAAQSATATAPASSAASVNPASSVNPVSSADLAPPTNPVPAATSGLPATPSPSPTPTPAPAAAPTPSATAAEVERWMMDGILKRAAAGRVVVQPGARELLAEVAASGLPYALVTSSQREFADAVLAGTGFRFPVVVCAEDVPATKPDPAPYLLAAKLLDVDPARCAVLEDSPNGVASATAAGCLVVAVPSLAPIPPAPGRLVVASLLDVTLATLRTLAK